MKPAKKLLALILVCAVFCCTATDARASEGSQSNEEYAIYENNHSEKIEIEGTIYTYHYCYDSDGNRTTYVINENTKDVDIVKYDSDLQCIILNGEICSQVVQQEKKMHDYLEKASSNSWIYFGKGSKKITFKQGISVAVLAAMIATAIGNLGGTAVIAAMGYSALSVIAAAAIGGTVTTTVYKFNSNLITQWRYDWSFKASTGDYYGVYTSLTQI